MAKGRHDAITDGLHQFWHHVFLSLDGLMDSILSPAKLYPPIPESAASKKDGEVGMCCRWSEGKPVPSGFRHDSVGGGLEEHDQGGEHK